MKRPTIYLHIGFHKTGTTSIQNFLAANAVRLAEQDCLIPVTGRAGNTHAYLANSLKKANVQLNADQLYADLAKEIAGSGKQKIIISSECFMEGIPPPRIRKQFDQLNAKIRIVVYLRRQDSWLQSLYNEVVRDPSRRYTGDILRMREVRKDVADYGGLLKKWEKAFGTRNIVVRVFEKEQMPNGLLADFVEAVGLQWRPDFYVNDSMTSGNAGFPDDLVVALRALNQIPMKRDMYQRLVATLAGLAQELGKDKRIGDYSLISPADRRSLVERYAEGNQRIARELLGREDGILFKEPLPDDAGNWREHEGPDAELQSKIFERLPDDIKAHFMQIHPRFRNIEQDADFFPLSAKSEEDRLRAVIHRLRTELNWLYEERGQTKEQVSEALNNRGAS